MKTLSIQQPWAEMICRGIIPDLQDENKPYIINFRNGEEAPWQVLQCLIKND